MVVTIVTSLHAHLDTVLTWEADVLLLSETCLTVTRHGNAGTGSGMANFFGGVARISGPGHMTLPPKQRGNPSTPRAPCAA